MAGASIGAFWAPSLIVFSDRPTDSRFVERIFRSHSTRSGTFQSVATSHCEIVFTRCRGDVRVSLRGPETKPIPADCPAEGEWMGIRLALETYFPHYPAATLRDRRDRDLPIASPRAFWLLGSAWEFPNLENAETFVARLVKAEVLARDAARRLREGASIAEAVGEGGFFDHAYPSRSLRRWTGQTHAQLQRKERQLSLRSESWRGSPADESGRGGEPGRRLAG